MSNKIFTQDEIEILSSNKYVKRVSSKGITYTDEFKRIFISENQKGKFPRIIFEECGFNIDILGMKRVESSGKRWRAAYRENGILGLQDNRIENSGRPSEKDLTLEDKYDRLKAQNKLLKAENELLKKNRNVGKGDGKEDARLVTEQKFQLIKAVVTKNKLKNMISYLCKSLGVSRSGYYNYFSSKSQNARQKRDVKDESVRDIILKAFNFKRRKKGARQIKMTLKGEFGIIYNLKRIRRIMKKYDIVCPIRKANPYRRMMKATQEHRALPNLLNRQFKQNIPGKVLLTDITYLFYGNGKKAYLSTVKDGSTNEILAYHLSDKMTLDIATETIHKLANNKQVNLAKDAFIHSDQGSHYTSPVFQALVRSYDLNQSMSRRGNCWDNAPQESFFGHFKDETYIKPCQSLCELGQEIDDYIIYYNNYRYQWGLNKMTPVQYRDHLLKTA
ncbi:MAG: IS3 family transposase [Bacillota bacterium]